MDALTTGSDNTAVGDDALGANYHCFSNNTAVGGSALLKSIPQEKKT
jgi:hypothetical protein